MRSETGDPGTFDKSLTRINFRALRSEIDRISRNPGMLYKAPYGVFHRNDVSLEALENTALLRLRSDGMS